MFLAVVKAKCWSRLKCGLKVFMLKVGIPGQGDSDFEVIPIKIPKLI
jgi:hypothetical protein